MYLHLFSIILLSQNCFCMYTGNANGEKTSLTHSGEPLKPPDNMMNDQGDPDSSDLWNGYFDRLSQYVYGGSIESTPIPPDVMNEGTDLLPTNQPESQLDVGSSEQLDYLSDKNTQDVIADIKEFFLNQPEELNHLSESNNTQDVITVSEEEFTVNKPESQVEVDVVDNEVVAVWVAALIFLIIAVYAVIFIIAVAILECKGKGRRTIDDEKFPGSSVEKQKLLNGATISEDTQDYKTADGFGKVNKSYSNGALPSESSSSRTYTHNQTVTDRTDLHHLLGSPVAEVEVFPHGSLQRPPKKGCLHY